MNPAAATTWPFASVATASKRTVSRSTTVSAGGETSTMLTRWATVTAAVPDADPAVAVIVTAPFPAAVTSPEASTDATDASLLAHVTAASAMRSPYWSSTCAESRAVSRRAANSRELGLTATRAGSGGSGGIVSSPPQDRAAARVRTTAGRRRQRRDEEKTS